MEHRQKNSRECIVPAFTEPNQELPHNNSRQATCMKSWHTWEMTESILRTCKLLSSLDVPVIIQLRSRLLIVYLWESLRRSKLQQAKHKPRKKRRCRSVWSAWLTTRLETSFEQCLACTSSTESVLIDGYWSKARPAPSANSTCGKITTLQARRRWPRTGETASVTATVIDQET